MRIRPSYVAAGLVLVLGGLLLVPVRSARRIVFVNHNHWAVQNSPSSEFDMDVPAEFATRRALLSWALNSQRLHGQLAERLADIEGFEAWPQSPPLAVRVASLPREVNSQPRRQPRVGDPKEYRLEVSLPAPCWERISFRQRGWVPTNEPGRSDAPIGPDALRERLRADFTQLVEEQSPFLRAEIAADEERQLERARLGRRVLRASRGKVRVAGRPSFSSVPWDQRKDLDLGAIDRLRQLLAFIPELPTLPRQRIDVTVGKDRGPRGTISLRTADLRSTTSLTRRLETPDFSGVRNEEVRSALLALRLRTGLMIEGSTDAEVSSRSGLPDLPTLLAGLDATGIFDHHVSWISYREEPNAIEVRFLGPVVEGEQPPGDDHDFPLPCSARQVLDWLSETVPTMPRLTEEELLARKPAPRDVSERQQTREASIGAVLDAGVWEMLEPGVEHDLVFGDTSFEIRCGTARLEAISYAPTATLVERMWSVYEPVLEGEEVARRRRVLARRDALEETHFQGVTLIEVDDVIPTEKLEVVLSALEAALADTPPEAAAFRQPVREVRICWRKPGWSPPEMGQQEVGVVPRDRVLAISPEASEEEIIEWLVTGPPEPGE